MKIFQAVPSKLLLFGEYSILAGSPAITVPLWDFRAKLVLSENKSFFDHESNQQLTKFVHFLSQSEYFIKHLNLPELTKCVNAGLYLESNIPRGYGLGSSASLCVAFYKAFGISKLEDPLALKEFYSRMESFFHGKSSGLDPLTIHTEKPLLAGNNSIEFLPDTNLLPRDIHLYLFDSGKTRNAGLLIANFKEMMEDVEYKNFFEIQYLPLLKDVIEAFIHQKIEFWNTLKELSEMQLRIFTRIIPEIVFPLWERSIQTENVCIKILGAGGGGFFLLFSKVELHDLEGFKVKSVLKPL